MREPPVFGYDRSLMSNSNRTLSPITRERANDAVHSAMRQAILSSVLRPGQRLNIPELADQLNVSLTPVRNAVQLLAAEGLIEVRPRSGTYVASVTVEDVLETFQIRRALECLGAELACQSMNPKEFETLRALLAAMRKPIRNDEERAQHERDNATFHLSILTAARNARLMDFYNRLNAHIQIARIHAADSDWKSRLKDERMEHEEIVDAIDARDPARAAEAVRAHLDRACASLVQAIRARMLANGAA
jgi:GntR family transcriptional regulator, rspAB operon transcriptional repressor